MQAVYSRFDAERAADNSSGNHRTYDQIMADIKRTSGTNGAAH